MSNFPSNFVSLRDRTILIIESEAPVRGKFVWLEEKTGIGRKTWQTFFNRKTASPSGELLQAIGRLFPKYAFWLTTGLADQAYGHTYPPSSATIDSKCFPLMPYRYDTKRFDDFFKHGIKMQMTVYDGKTEGYKQDEQALDYEELLILHKLRHQEILMLMNIADEKSMNPK